VLTVTFLGVDGDAHQFRTRAGQFSDLLDRRRYIGGIGIGHRLHHNGSITADRDRANPNGETNATRELGISTGH